MNSTMNSSMNRSMNCWRFILIPHPTHVIRSRLETEEDIDSLIQKPLISEAVTN